MSTLSVVTPNYNHAEYLPRAIEAILDQSRRPDEYLILDDGSTDNSVEIIESYARRHPVIRLIRHEKNQGLMPAIHRLFEEAKGTYYYGGAADDHVLPGFFERAMAAAAQRPEAGLILSPVVGIGARGERMVARVEAWTEAQHIPPVRFLHEYLERESVSLVVGTVFRRECMLDVGGYRPELGYRPDTFLVESIGLKYGAYYVPEPGAVFFERPTGFGGALRNDPFRNLEIIFNTSDLMQSERFQSVFPADYVERWTRTQVQIAIGRATWLLRPEGGRGRLSLLQRARAWALDKRVKAYARRLEQQRARAGAEAPATRA